MFDCMHLGRGHIDSFCITFYAHLPKMQLTYHSLGFVHIVFRIFKIHIHISMCESSFLETNVDLVMLATV